MASEKIVSTWMVARSGRVYLRQSKLLPSALSARWLLCCLTRKEKKERGAGRGGGGDGVDLGAFPPPGVLFPGDGGFSEAAMWWSSGRWMGGILNCIDVCVCSVCVCVHMCVWAFVERLWKVLSEEFAHFFNIICNNLLWNPTFIDLKMWSSLILCICIVFSSYFFLHTQSYFYFYLQWLLFLHFTFQ